MANRERPILFCGDMVLATLDNRKTQTRRVIKPTWSRCLDLDDDPEDREKARVLCPYGKPGDLLWVRETWHCEELDDGLDGIRYKADGSFVPIKDTVEASNDWIVANDNRHDFSKWRPSIFMPRWASRITLRITGVDVQRLQDITIEDVVAEGIHKYTLVRGIISNDLSDPRWKFIELWDSLNAKRGFGWITNPYVWKISFKRILP